VGRSTRGWAGRFARRVSRAVGQESERGCWQHLCTWAAARGAAGGSMAVTRTHAEGAHWRRPALKMIIHRPAIPKHKA